MGNQHADTAGTPTVASEAATTDTGLTVSDGLNHAVIVGQLVAEPEWRTLASGSTAASFSLTVRVAGRKTTSVPIVWYDPPKRLMRWRIGDLAAVRGSVVRRFFRGGAGLGSATEVVVEQAELVRQGARVVSLLCRSRQQLEGFMEGTDW